MRKFIFSKKVVRYQPGLTDLDIFLKVQLSLSFYMRFF